MEREPTCRFYQSGSCINDELCTFNHPTKRCSTFKKDGWCPYGLSCHFWHDPKYGTQSETVNKSTQKICRFFLNGQCLYGDQCAYSHNFDDLTNNTCGLTMKEFRAKQAQNKLSIQLRKFSSSAVVNKNSTNHVTTVVTNPTRPAVARPNTRLEVAYLDHVQADDLKQMKDLEIDRLCKLFPKDQLKEIGGNEDLRSFVLLFASTDPDWVYEVKKILICLSFPPNYPLLPLTITVPNSSELPRLLIKNLNESIQSWIVERNKSNESENKVALYLRPFLFWLDKNLPRLFEEGYKMDAESAQNNATESDHLEVYETNQTIPDHFSSSSSDSSTSPDNSDTSDIEYTPSSSAASYFKPKPESVNLENESESLFVIEKPLDSEINNKDSKVIVENDTNGQLAISANEQRLTFDNLEFRGQASVCLFVKIAAWCFCSRCKFIFEWIFRLPPLPDSTVGRNPQQSKPFQSLPPNTSTCSRCRQSFGLLFEAMHVHAFSNVIGIFKLINCSVADAQTKTAEIQILCTNCNSYLKMSKLEPDRLNATRCTRCHLYSGFTFSNIILSALQKSSSEVVNQFASLSLKSGDTKPSRRTKKANKGESQAHVIVKGTSLPNNGSCKHYQKSFRWFKFQCCNRSYPCDTCHNEEAANSHEALYASRMICGFCSKEQVFTPTQPCIACHKSLIGNKTAHWEGGKGCRDQTKMSRKDAKKFANSTKTKPKK